MTYKQVVKKINILLLVTSRISFETLQTLKNIGATCVFDTKKYLIYLKFKQDDTVVITCHYYKWFFIPCQKQYYFKMKHVKNAYLEQWDPDDADDDNEEN